MKKSSAKLSKAAAPIQAATIKTASPGELFVVATPIGNLADITLRAIEVLKSVSLIACEDTRTSGVLLRHYGIATPTTAHHTHNEARSTEALVAKLQAGALIALISDAGTPLVSDPGERLVQAAIAAGIRVTPIPGASAVLSAISISGLPAMPFYFAGFLPSKSSARREAFAAVKSIPATLVFYESPNRLEESLRDAQTTLGDRPAAVARELTKMHEECRRGALSELHAYYAAHPPRGECVLLIAPSAPAPVIEAKEVDALLTDLLCSMSVKEAAAEAAEQTRLPKRDLYQRALELKDKR